jgi:hypothetical protein
MTAVDFAPRIRGAHRRGAGPWWDGFCPAHDDQREESLSFRDGDKGLLVKCHRGCSVAAIAKALGLTVRDFFHDAHARSNGNGHAGGPTTGRGRVVGTYDYRDESGALLFQSVRRADPKGFYQRRADGKGGWINDLKGVRLVVFGLPDLQGQREVFIPEGEKDAERLRAHGLTATCNPMGASTSTDPRKSKWLPEYTQQLVEAGAEFVPVLADNDVAGQRHAETVAASCHAAGLRVRLVRQLPGSPPVRDKHGEDVSDWLDAGHTLEELRAVVDATPDYVPPSSAAPTARPRTRWDAAQDVTDFLASEIPPAHVLDDDSTIAPGALGEWFSPRGIGKTHVLHAKLVQLAQQGKRVLLLDRDNPLHEIHRRLAGWGAGSLPPGRFKVMSRDDTPPMTSRAEWQDFPFSDYDAVAVDSLDSSTEGVGEQDSGRPALAIGVLLDLAHRAAGPAIATLGNTTKNGKTGRGSGVVEDRADIVYEVRDVTDFHPTGAKPWWEEMPPAAREDWAGRASRRKQRDRYRLAFTNTKFRIGQEPAPFVLEVDFTTTPWTLRNVTADLERDGAQAQEHEARERAARREAAALALMAELGRPRVTGQPWPKSGTAEALLREHGLSRAGARRLLTDPDRPWTLTPKDSKTVLVMPRDSQRSAESGSLADPHKQRRSEEENSAGRMDSGRRDVGSPTPNIHAGASDPEIPPLSMILGTESPAESAADDPDEAQESLPWALATRGLVHPVEHERYPDEPGPRWDEV